MKKNSSSYSVSPKNIEDRAKNDVKELLDELVVSPIKYAFPDALKKTETAIQSIDEKTKNILSRIPEPSSLACKVKDTLIFSDDFIGKIAEASGAKDIEDIKDDIEGIKGNVGKLKNNLDNVATKTDQISASATEAHDNIAKLKDDIKEIKGNVGKLKNNLNNVAAKTDQLSASATEAHDNITKLIEALIEEVEAQREMIEKQTETIEQQRSFIEKIVTEMSSTKNKVKVLNRQIWKSYK